MKWHTDNPLAAMVIIALTAAVAAGCGGNSPQPSDHTITATLSTAQTSPGRDRLGRESPEAPLKAEPVSGRSALDSKDPERASTRLLRPSRNTGPASPTYAQGLRGRSQHTPCAPWARLLLLAPKTSPPA